MRSTFSGDHDLEQGSRCAERRKASLSYRGYEVALRVDRLHQGYEPVGLTNPREMYGFMAPLGHESAEHMYAVLMDTRNRVNGVYLVGKGGVHNCLVDPREVFKAALVTNSPAFALVHNHPSGVLEPSSDDCALTERLRLGAELLNLDFLDSIIVADGRYLSFFESGRLPRRSG